MNVARVLWAMLGAVASGALLALALPPADVGILGWVAFTPVLAAVRNTRFSVGFLAGLGASLTCAAVSAWGVFYPGSRGDGDAAWTFVGCFLFGLVVAIVAGIWAETKRTTAGAAAALAAGAVLLEAALIVYLPAHLGLTQHLSPLALLVASFTGIWGVSFLVWLANLALSATFSARGPRSVGTALGVVSAAALSVVPVWRDLPPEVRVAALQTEHVDERELAEATRRAGGLGAILVVWPEFSGIAVAPRGDVAQLEALSADPSIPAFVTTFNDDQTPRPRNVAAMFHGGRERGRYAKRKLFGGESQMHTPGREAGVAELAEMTIGLNVCFDSCFPHVMRDTRRRMQRGVIVLPTIDPVAPHGFLAAIHAAYTPFRAAELGVPMVRADGYAFSAIYGPDGRTLARAGRGEDLVVADVNLGWSTPYAVLGDWALAVCAGGVLFSLFRRRRSATSPPVPEPVCREPDHPATSRIPAGPRSRG
jgi:apolipoprotein N-acyltransferase